MASSVTQASASSSRADSEQRPQAGPLPLKPGEIGYTEPQDVSDDTDDPMEDALTGPHPAERQTDTRPAPEPSSSSTSLPQANSSTTTTSSSSSIRSKRSILSFFTRSSQNKETRIFGFTTQTTLRFIFQISLIGATIVPWVYAANHIKAISTPSSDASNSSSSTAAIFIHVAFAIAIFVQLLFLERCVFQLRAERYSFLHPGSILPQHRSLSSAPSSTSNFAFAPWNRPPLPTYAAALGIRGTGDVEDGMIAVNPPPAYGNTRGSTLLLAGFLRQSQIRRESIRSMTSVLSRSSRPESYDGSEERVNAERARKLEEALARLEEGHASSLPA